MKLLAGAALFLLVTVGCFAAAASDRTLFKQDDPDAKVLFVPQFSEFQEVSESDMRYLKKVLGTAEKEKYAAVIFELDTPGGRVDVALRYLSIFARSPVKVIAYLNPQGISAGMLIALGADRIAINPKGMIGDAMPLEIGLRGVRPIAVPPDRKDVPAPAVSPAPAKKQEGQKPSVSPEKPSEKDSPGALDEVLRQLQKIGSGADKNKDEDREAKRLTDQKFLSFFFKALECLAQKNQRPVRVIRATADPYCELTKEKDGIEHKTGGPLTLSAQDAVRLGVADYLASDRQEILKGIGLPSATIVEAKKNVWEQMFGFLALPAVAGILISLGLVGIFVEIKTPGFGVPGILGILALVLFFWGQAATGASEWSPMVIFFIGLVLLLLEIFVIPGFGLVGILGVICIVGSFLAAFGWGNIERAATVVGSALAATLAVIVVLATYVLPRSSFFDFIKLNAVSGVDDRDDLADGTGHSAFDGREGVLVSPLRPSGIVEIDGSRHEAVSSGDFLERGTRVRVVGRNSFSLIVEPVEVSTTDRISSDQP